MTSAEEGWEKVRRMTSVSARFSVAFHQASNTTSSVGQWRPSEVMRRLFAEGQQARELHQEPQVADRMVLPQAGRSKNMDFSYFRKMFQHMAHRFDKVVVLLLLHPYHARRKTLLQCLGQRIHVPDDGVRETLLPEMRQIGLQGTVAADRPLSLLQQVQRIRLFRKKAVAEYGGATVQRDVP